MQSSSNFFKPWTHVSKQSLQTLLLIGFLSWTSLLTIETVNVQNSCHPMFNWERKPTELCPPKQKSTDNNTSDRGTIPKDADNNNSGGGTIPKDIEERCTEGCPPPPPKFNTTTISVAAGGVAAAIATIAGAPVFVTVGIMIVVGLMAKSILALAK
jgi:hypothetical protein